MGRVRRYKKIKAVDPFAKKTKAEVDTVHDEPPAFHQDRVKHAIKNTRKFESNLMAQYRKAAKEIEVFTNTVESKKKSKKKVVVEPPKSGLEGRREGESMKAFKIRIRQETRKTLRDELHSLTSTAQKRKSRLKERKQKRKAGKNGRADADSYFNRGDDERFGSSDQGAVRNSDRQDGIENFPTRDTVKFGERVEAPPDLRHTFTMAGAKKAGLGVENKKRRLEDGEDGPSQDKEGPSTAGMRFVQQQNKRARAAAEEGRQQGVLHAGSGSRASAADVELARDQAIKAYKALQKKRRATDGQNFSSI